MSMNLKKIGFFNVLVFPSYVVAALIFYWNGLMSPWFNSISFSNMLAFSYMTKWEHLIHFFTRFYHAAIWEREYHPLVTFIFYLNTMCAGDSLIDLKLINLTFIISCAYLSYILIRDFVKNSFWAFVAGFLFLIHPIHAEPICAPDMNTDLIMTFFVLCVLISHIKFKRSHKKRWLVVLVVTYLLALFSKETAIVVPFIIFVFDCLLPVEPKKIFKKENFSFKEYLFLVLVTLGYVALQLLVINFEHINFKNAHVLSSNGLGMFIIDPVRNFTYALKFLMFPYVVGGSISFFGMILTWIMYVIIFLIIRKVWTWKVPTFCLLWIFLALLPILGFLPIEQLIVQLHTRSVDNIWMYRRYLILPAFGLVWFFVLFLKELGATKGLKIISFSLLAIFIFCSERACGLSIFSDINKSDDVICRIATKDTKSVYSFRNSFFSEVVLTSLGTLSVRGDQQRLNRIRYGLYQDFTPEQIEEIISFFADTSLHKNPKKLYVYMKVRKIREPQKFWNEFMRLRLENKNPKNSIKFNKLDDKK
jgi:hypothetical protein